MMSENLWTRFTETNYDVHYLSTIKQQIKMWLLLTRWIQSKLSSQSKILRWRIRKSETNEELTEQRFSLLRFSLLHRSINAMMILLYLWNATGTHAGFSECISTHEWTTPAILNIEYDLTSYDTEVSSRGLIKPSRPWSISGRTG